MDWIELIKYIVTALCGGGLAGVLTFGITKKKMNAEAKSAAAAADEAYAKVMKEHVDLIKTLEGRIAELLHKYQTDTDALNEEIKKLIEEASTKGFCMCVHMGCVVRHPAPGRGAIYYDQHKDEMDFGVDYIPIEELIARYKRKGNKEQTIMKIKSDETNEDTY